ncbi:MAG: hypothetical protein ABIK09_16145 [Pseudomonadota bacterium]
MVDGLALKEDPVSDRRMDRVETELRTLTREEIHAAVGEEVLSREEELLVRMRYGLGLGAGDHLEFRGQENEETRIKLAMMEKALLDELAEQQTDDLTSLLND